MPYETKFVPRTHNAICDICGFQIKAKDGRITWDGKFVCPLDWEPKHPVLEVPPVLRNEGLTAGITRSEGEVEYTTDAINLTRSDGSSPTSDPNA